MSYVQILKRYQAYRFDPEVRTLSEFDLTHDLVSDAIEWAINNLDGMEDDGK